MENISNPLLNDWRTPYQTPLFHLIEPRHFAPAIHSAIREAEACIDSIATSPAPPTFDNTLVALEEASLPLDRILALLLNLNECCTNPELHEAVMQLLPEVTYRDYKRSQRHLHLFL